MRASYKCAAQRCYDTEWVLNCDACVLTEQTTAVFYQGFTITGGALYFACIDCNSTADVGVDIISVDAHDSRENGTQPPVSLIYI